MDKPGILIVSPTDKRSKMLTELLAGVNVEVFLAGSYEKTIELVNKITGLSKDEIEKL